MKKRVLSLMLSLIIAIPLPTLAASYKAECLSPKAKFVDCALDVKNETIIVTYKSSKYNEQNKTIPGNKISKISGGEYSRRRVGESIGYSFLLGPVMLFTLFSKKKRDNFGIEYLNELGKKDALLVQVKKKYGLALKTDLQSISGLEVEMEETNNKKGK